MAKKHKSKSRRKIIGTVRTFGATKNNPYGLVMSFR